MPVGLDTPMYERKQVASSAKAGSSKQANALRVYDAGYAAEDRGAKEAAAKGALTGASIGATIGTGVAPGVGTAIGAVGGALVGSLVGFATGGEDDKAAAEKAERQAIAAEKRQAIALRQANTAAAQQARAASGSAGKGPSTSVPSPGGSTDPAVSSMPTASGAGTAYDAWRGSVYGG